MPTYEYRCTSCGEHLEVVQSFSEEPLTECPNCGGQLRKVFSPVGIVFKGSGFYKTDNRGRAKGAQKAKETEKTSSSEKSDSSSSGSTAGETTSKTDSKIA